jgi:NAD+--dinitrogen-reductase ADP-D-ribosyltransferase
MPNIYRTVGHSSNLVGLPTLFFASCDFNDQPMRVHISGTREMNDNLFKMLSRQRT